jgi:ATP-dependent DNA ligase
MQTRARSTSIHPVAKASIELPANYYAFDVLQGEDLRKCTLVERKRILRKPIPSASAVVYSDHVDALDLQTYATAQRSGVKKRAPLQSPC